MKNEDLRCKCDDCFAIYYGSCTILTEVFDYNCPFYKSTLRLHRELMRYPEYVGMYRNDGHTSLCAKRRTIKKYLSKYETEKYR